MTHVVQLPMQVTYNLEQDTYNTDLITQGDMETNLASAPETSDPDSHDDPPPPPYSSLEQVNIRCNALAIVTSMPPPYSCIDMSIPQSEPPPTYSSLDLHNM